MSMIRAAERIRQAVLGWSGTEARPHRFGGTEFRQGRREIGHVRGDHLVDIPFPQKVRDEILAASEAQPHHILPESGWFGLHLRSAEDTERAIRLLRSSHGLALKQRQKPQAT